MTPNQAAYSGTAGIPDIALFKALVTASQKSMGDRPGRLQRCRLACSQKRQLPPKFPLFVCKKS